MKQIVQTISLKEPPSTWKKPENKTSLGRLLLPTGMQFKFEEHPSPNKYKKTFKFYNKNYQIQIFTLKKSVAEQIYSISNTLFNQKLSNIFFKVKNKRYLTYYFKTKLAMNGATAHSLLVQKSINETYQVSIIFTSKDSKDEIAKQILGSIELN